MNIPRWMQAISRDQGGIILPLVLVFLAVGLLLLAPTLGHGYSAIAGTSVTENRAEQLHAADSGIEEAIYWITRHQPGKYEWNEDEGRWERTNPYLLNGKLVDVTITPEPGDDEHLYRIVSRAEDPDSEGSSTVLAFVFAVPFAEYIEGDGNIDNQNPVPANDIVVNGDLSIGGNPAVPINMHVTGDLNLANNPSITGTVSAEGDITLANNASITTSQICLGGDLTLGNNSELTADVVFTNTYDCDPESTCEPDGSYNLTLSQAGAKITGNVFAYGDLDIYIANNAEIDGNIYVWGDASLNLAGPHSKITGTIYYCEDSSYTPVKHQQASFPQDQQCASECECLAQPAENCPAVPTNEAQIVEWEIT